MKVVLTVSEHAGVDVLVAGGGIAGVCAAVAACQAGARTLLVEEMGCLGGNATTGGVAAFCGETRGQGQVFDEIVARLERLDAIAPYRPYEQREARPFDHQVLAYVLQELAVEAGAEILLFTQAVGALRDGDSVSAVVLSNRSGLSVAPAKVIIDATGEACVARSAGLPIQPVGDGLLPMSVIFFMRQAPDPESLPQAEVRRPADCPWGQLPPARAAGVGMRANRALAWAELPAGRPARSRLPARAAPP